MEARISKALRAGILSVSVAAVAVTGMPLSASADPGAVAQAKATVERLGMEAAALDQQAVGAQEELEKASARAATREKDVQAQSAKVAGMRGQVSQIALSQFQNRNVSPTAQVLLRSDVDGFLSEYSTIQQVGNNQNATLQEFQTQQSNLADMQRAAAADADTIAKSTQQVKAARADSEKKLKEAQAVLNRLTAEERARLQAEQEREAREAEAAASRSAAAPPANGRRETASPSASPSSRSTKSDSKSSDTPVSAPPGSSRGAQALAYARAQIGKSYQSGGVGPSSYDCSGLTMMAWKSAGVSLPRTSQQQIGAGTSVSKSELQPGDLVFYYSGISHVALYAGNGQILHASRPGKPIGYDSLDSMPFAGARRVG